MGKLNITYENITIDNTLATDVNHISEYGSLTSINSALYLESRILNEELVNIHTSIDNSGSIIGVYDVWQDDLRGKEYRGYYLDMRKENR